MATGTLVKAIEAAPTPPAVFVSSSAVGYYGPRGDEIVTEETAPGSDFLARLCVDWEAAATEGGRTHARRADPNRTGARQQRRGAVQAAAALQDVRRRTHGIGPAVLAVDSSRRLGRHGPMADDGRRPARPLQCERPAPVTNAELSKALGRALHRPSLLPAPPFAMRLLLGEMSDALLMSGQRAVPKRASEAGFVLPLSNRRCGHAGRCCVS